jgi:hypothetical protein
MAKRETGKGFDGIFGNNTKEPKEIEPTAQMEKIHCDIPKDLKFKVDLFKVKHSITVKEIVSAALTEYIQKHDEKLFRDN